MLVYYRTYVECELIFLYKNIHNFYISYYLIFKTFHNNSSMVHRYILGKVLSLIKNSICFIYSTLYFPITSRGILGSLFTLIVPKPKVISFATSIGPGQPTHPWNLTQLYIDGWSTSSSQLDITKMVMDSSRNSAG